MKVNLFDNNIPSYDKRISEHYGDLHFNVWQPLEGFRYEKNIIPKEDGILLVTDENLFNLQFQNIKCRHKFGLLVEPRSIKPHVYETLKNNYKKLTFYKKIFTHSQELIDISELFELVPFLAGSWILKEDFRIYKKTKNISIVASEKCNTIGHKLRHDIVANFKNDLDAFGPGYIDLKKDYVDITAPCNLKECYDHITGNLFRAFKDYRYNFAVHSIRYKNYFDEKLLNCFFTGTVPILYGATNIAELFDKRGIIEITDLQDVDKVIKGCNDEDYNNRLPYIIKNYELAFKYISFDNYVFNLMKTYLPNNKV